MSVFLSILLSAYFVQFRIYILSYIVVFIGPPLFISATKESKLITASNELPFMRRLCSEEILCKEEIIEYLALLIFTISPILTDV